MKKLFAFVFRSLGWSIKGNIPATRKYVLVVAPHTSNWDFLVGIGARALLNFYPRYVGKKELFKWPFGSLFRKLGGYPVERTSKSNFVESIVDIIKSEDDFILTITPEGTRSHSPNWRSGFFHIAKKANIPIVPVAFDYPNKCVVIGEEKMATGTAKDFINDLKKWYVQFQGLNPQDGILKEDIF